MRRTFERWAALTVAAALLLGGLSGCSLNDKVRGLSSSAAQGAAAGGIGYLRSDSGRAALRGVTDSTFAMVAVGLRTSLTPVLDSTVAGVLGRGQAFLGATTDSLTLAIRGPLNAALQELIRANARTFAAELNSQLSPALAGAGAELRTQLSLTADTAGAAYARVFLPLVQNTVDSLSTRLAANAASGPLRGAIDSVVASAVRTGIGEARTQSRSIWREKAPWLLGGLAIGLAVIAWLWRERQKTQRALFAMAEAVRNTPDPAMREAMKDNIKASARSHRIDGYLHTFLEKKELLNGSEKVPRKVYAGTVVGDATVPAGATAAAGPASTPPAE